MKQGQHRLLLVVGVVAQTVRAARYSQQLTESGTGGMSSTTGLAMPTSGPNQFKALCVAALRRSAPRIVRGFLAAPNPAHISAVA